MDLLGRTLGRYRIVNQLTTDEFVDTYRGRQETLGWDVTIQVFQVVPDDDFRTWFEALAENMLKIRHPNILRVLEYGVQDDMAYIITDYVDGKRLTDLGERLSRKEAVQFVRQIGQSLVYMRLRHIRHQEIDSENIIFDQENTPLLINLGVKDILDRIKHQTNYPRDSDSFSSRPSHSASSVDARLDVKQLGIVFYEMLTGEAYAPDTLEILYGLRKAESCHKFSLIARIPTKLKQIILQAIDDTRADQFKRVEDLLKALPESRPPKPVGKPKTFKTAGGRRKTGLAFILLLLSLVLVGFILAAILEPGTREMVLSWFPAATATPSPTATPMPTRTRTPRPTPAPTSTPTHAPMFTLTATLVPTITPTQTHTSTRAPTFTPTAILVSPITSTQTPTLVSTSTPTHTPTPTRTAAPLPMPFFIAEAERAASIFEGPSVQTAELGIVYVGNTVSILGRADAQKWGRWLYIVQDDIVGFVDETRFSYTIDWDSLRIIDVKDSIAIVLPNASEALAIPAGVLRIEYVQAASECLTGGWMAYFEVRISGGDGQNYSLFWDQTLIPFSVQEAEKDVAMIQFVGGSTPFAGTVWVESGGQRVGLSAYLDVPDCS
ncbi:MAG: protein kinase [Anaerolineae bacterium]|nr:protein kinase [Anaerolineae bacterium]